MLNGKIGKFEQEMELCSRMSLPISKGRIKSSCVIYKAVGFVLTAFSLD